MKKFFGVRTVFVVWLCLLVVIPSFAQQDRGVISGRVMDPSGAALPGTTILLRNLATGVVQNRISNETGDYTFDLLDPGRYSITVERDGYKKVSVTDIQVDVAGHVTKDLTLALGNTTQTIEVSAMTEQLEKSDSSVGTIIESKSIQELPLIYGNPYALEFLAPGVLPSGVNPNIHTYDSSTATVSVNGSVLNALEYRLDGAPNNRIRLSAYTPSTEIISQYKVSTSTYDATEGHTAGGSVNTALKSGTNGWHGNASGYYQNANLNAHPWVLANAAASRPTFLREVGSLGGPIKKDKAFFFVGYEHSRQANANPQVLTVPTMAERSGDFSAHLLGDTGQSNSNCASGKKYDSYQLFNPLSAAVVSKSNTHVCRQVFAGNIIPSSLINPIATKVLSYYPKPNLAGNADDSNNYSYAGSEPDYYYAVATRLDYNLDDRQKLFGHFVVSRRLQPGKNAYFSPVSGTTLTYQNRGALIDYTNVLNAKTVLDVKASWTRFMNQNVISSQGIVSPSDLGMPSYLVNGRHPQAIAMPRFDLTGYTSIQADSGVVSHDDITMGSVSVSRLQGSHEIRFGAEYRFYNVNGASYSNEQGDYSSNGYYTTVSDLVKPKGTVFSVAQFLMGLPSSSKVVQNADMAVRSQYITGYVHDNWRALPNVTLNIGLRYEYESPSVERHDKAATYFDFNATNPIAASAQAAYAAIAGTNSLLPSAGAFKVNGGLRFAGQDGNGGYLYTAPKLSLLPRIGLSWSPNNATVIRTGFGIFKDSLFSYYMSGANTGSTSTFIVPQQGYSATSSVSGTTDNGLTFVSTLANPFPGGLSQPSGNSNGLKTYLGQNIQFLTPNPSIPYNMRWSLDLQRQVGSWIMDIAYIGNRSVHLGVALGTSSGTGQEFNPIPRQYLSTKTDGPDGAVYSAMTATVNNPFYGLYADGGSIFTSKTIGVNQLLKPYPEFSSVNSYTFGGFGLYNSLQATANRRFSNHLSVNTAFTWSKSMDATQLLNATDVRPWYGISANDRTLRFSGSMIYELPLGQGRALLGDSQGLLAKIIGNWQAQGMYQVQSGQPLSFTSAAYIYNGLNSDPNTAAWSRDSYKKSIVASNAGYWFNTANWITDSTLLPYSAYQIRQLGYRFSALRADHLNQLDMGVQRNFNIREFATLQFRAEAINVLNHPVYSAPSTNPTDKSFGQITSQANQPRVWQWVGIIRF